jgi:hypothetical protein
LFIGKAQTGIFMMQIANQRFGGDTSGTAGIKISETKSEVVRVGPSHVRAVPPLRNANHQARFGQQNWAC